MGTFTIKELSKNGKEVKVLIQFEESEEEVWFPLQESQELLKSIFSEMERREGQKKTTVDQVKEMVGKKMTVSKTLRYKVVAVPNKDYEPEYLDDGKTNPKYDPDVSETIEEQTIDGFDYVMKEVKK